MPSAVLAAEPAGPLARLTLVRQRQMAIGGNLHRAENQVLTDAVDALAAAGKRGEDVDMVLCAAANMQRAYPAMAVEIQQAVGAQRIAVGYIGGS